MANVIVTRTSLKNYANSSIINVETDTQLLIQTCGKMANLQFSGPTIKPGLTDFANKLLATLPTQYRPKYKTEGYLYATQGNTSFIHIFLSFYRRPGQLAGASKYKHRPFIFAFSPYKHLS